MLLAPSRYNSKDIYMSLVANASIFSFNASIMLNLWLNTLVLWNVTSSIILPSYFIFTFVSLVAFVDIVVSVILAYINWFLVIILPTDVVYSLGIYTFKFAIKSSVLIDAFLLARLKEPSVKKVFVFASLSIE